MPCRAILSLKPDLCIYLTMIFKFSGPILAAGKEPGDVDPEYGGVTTTHVMRAVRLHLFMTSE